MEVVIATDIRFGNNLYCSTFLNMNTVSLSCCKPKNEIMDIKKYRTTWNTQTNEGTIDFVLKNGEEETITFDNPAEFTAVMIVLQGEGTAFMNNNHISVRSHEHETWD